MLNCAGTAAGNPIFAGAPSYTRVVRNNTSNLVSVDNGRTRRRHWITVSTIRMTYNTRLLAFQMIDQRSGAVLRQFAAPLLVEVFRGHFGAVAPRNELLSVPADPFKRCSDFRTWKCIPYSGGCGRRSRASSSPFALAKNPPLDHL